jgi:hypothetical protein
MAGYAGTITLTNIGKVAFSPEPQFFDIYHVERLVGFFLMLNFNKFMFQFLFKSFERNGSSVTTLLNFLSNSLLNVINHVHKGLYRLLHHGRVGDSQMVARNGTTDYGSSFDCLR